MSEIRTCDVAAAITSYSYNPITFIYKIVLSLVGNPQDLIIQGHSFDDMLGLIGSDGKVHVVTEPLVYTRGTGIE